MVFLHVTVPLLSLAGVRDYINQQSMAEKMLCNFLAKS